MLAGQRCVRSQGALPTSLLHSSQGLSLNGVRDASSRAIALSEY